MARYMELGADKYPFQIESDVSVDVIIPVMLDAAPEALTTAAPAVSVGCYFTELDATSNAVAATLADGVLHGQLKKIKASVVTGGAVTVTIASPVSAALDVVTFTVIGDCVELIWNENDGAGYWRILELSDTDGDVDTPTVA